MFRLLGIALVVVAFGATLYYSGDRLEAWESPKAAAQSAPDAQKKKPKKHRKRAAARKHARRPATKPPTTWLTRLNTLCRRSEAQAAAIPPPITEEGALDYLQQVVQVARRFNRKADGLLRAGAAPGTSRQMADLFAQEERLLASILTAANRNQFERANELMPALRSVGRSENRILRGLGARDCTVSENEFEL